MSIWAVMYAGISTQVLVLIRGLLTRNWRRYPFFYLQLFCSFLFALTMLGIVYMKPSLYAPCYWVGEFATMLLACGNFLEILRGFAANPRAAAFTRAMRYIVYSITAIFAVGSVLAAIYIGLDWKTRESAILLLVFERDFRLVQAGFLFAIMGAALYFAVPFSRNLKGICIGYGLFIASDLMELALAARASVSADFFEVLRALGPFFYDVSLFVYLFALWSYTPPPTPELIFARNAAGDGLVVSRIRWIARALRGRKLDSAPERIDAGSAPSLADIKIPG